MRFFAPLSAFFLITSLQAQPTCDDLNAGFTYSAGPNGVQFSNGTTGTGEQTTWQWAFGDGTTSNDGQPFHTYTTAGNYEVCLYAITIYFNGSTPPLTCVDTACAVVNIGGGGPCDDLEACFVASQPAANTMHFNNCTQPGTNTQYVWTFGDGSDGSSTSPTHTYLQPGSYTVCLKAYWNGCLDEYCTTIVVEGGNDPCDQLEAGFSFAATSNGVEFTNTTTGTGQPTSWFWTFGDNTTSTLAQPFHTYVEPGTYVVCLYAFSVYTTGGGAQITCADTTCAPVVITGGTDPCDGLSADFWFGNNGIPANIFYSASTGTGPHWLWSFGDGTYSDNGPQGTHTYTAAGTYEMCLTVWDWIPGTDDTCSVTTCQLVVIEGGDPCDDFTACFVTNDFGNGTFFFDNCSSNQGNGQFYWTFGDGGVSTVVNAEHHYTQAGTYEVCLYAYYGNCSDTTCTPVVVAGVGNVCDELEAGFTWTTTPNGTQFSNGTTGTGQSTTWHWTFGDGATSDDGQPFHTFAEPGEYEVCLYAISIYPNTAGGVITCVDTTCAVVVIEGGGSPCDDLEACFVPSQTGLLGVLFNNCTAPGTNTQYVWHFGDGSTGSGVSPTHIYDQPGTYTVCLSAYWNDCVDEYCTTVVVGAGNPCEDLNAGFQVVVTGALANFQNAVVSPTFTYIWHFGDGSGGYGPNPAHTYPGPGTYTACLLVWAWNATTQDTCFADHCELVTVGDGDPCDDFSACFVTNDLGNGTFFFDNCSSNQGNGQFYWTFGDGSVSTVVNAEHHYAQGGTYEACLYAYYGNCADTTCTTIVVGGGGNVCDELQASFEWTSTPNGVYFSSNSTGLGQSTTWSWTFGDGASGAGSPVVHLYAQPGTYHVCLLVTSIYQTSSGVITCTDEYCYDVVVGGGNPCDDLVACFEATAVDNDSFQFTNCTQPSTNIQYVWHFGDGSNGSGPNPDHTYAEPGTYNVCLVVYWNDCTEEICHEVVVEGAGDICDQLVAGFSTTNTPNGTYFINATTGTGFQTTWHWTFGDGGTSDAMSSSHIYDQPGTYQACLVVVSVYETVGGLVTCTDEICHEVVIGGGDPCDDLVACFEAVAVDNDSYLFQNCTQPSTNIQYVWHFGDGSTGSEVNPDHTYAEPGTYTVCLTAYWENCVDEVCTTIVVGGANGCQPFQVDFDYTVQGNAVVFEATASVPVVGYLWYFGDGGEGYGHVVTHLYEPPGPYNVCVTAWYWNSNTQDTCWADHCEWVDPFQNGVGISETGDDAVHVYPNPARGVLTIDGLASPCDVLIYSPEGRLVLQQRASTTRHSIGVEQLAPAIYSLELRRAEGSLWRRIAIE